VTPIFIIGLAGILVEQGRYNEAENLARSALDIQRTIGLADPIVNETFVVNGKHFSAVTFAPAQFGGFAADPGPRYVRISYLDGSPQIILRVEVRQ